jgi:hypothetical protein
MHPDETDIFFASLSYRGYKRGVNWKGGSIVEPLPNVWGPLKSSWLVVAQICDTKPSPTPTPTPQPPPTPDLGDPPILPPAQTSAVKRVKNKIEKTKKAKKKPKK